MSAPAGKGMLQSLGAALGELFHGGKLEPRQEVSVEVLFGLLGYLGAAVGALWLLRSMARARRHLD